MRRFASRKKPYSPQRAIKEIPLFVWSVNGSLRGALDQLSVEEVQRLQSELAYHLDEIASGRDFRINLASVTLCAMPGRRFEIAEDSGSAFLLACMDLVGSPQGRLIAKCARDGCREIIIRLGRSRYCSKGSKGCAGIAEREQAQKRRAELDLATRYQSRHERYVAEVRGKKGKSFATKVARRGVRLRKETVDGAPLSPVQAAELVFLAECPHRFDRERHDFEMREHRRQEFGKKAGRVLCRPRSEKFAAKYPRSRGQILLIEAEAHESFERKAAEIRGGR